MKDSLVIPIKVIVNQMLNTGIFPNRFKIAKVLPLYKKGEKHILINYRPISLLPSISNFFEKVIYIQLYNYFESNNLFSASRYGFRSKQSTEPAALEVVDRIIFEMDKGKIPFDIYLDLSKAFDTINHDIMLQKLSYYGIQGTYLSLLQRYLFDRKKCVNYDNANSNMLSVKPGVPSAQGCLRGPLLFLIYINDISCFS